MDTKPSGFVEITPMLPTFEQAYSTIPGDGWLYETEARLLWNTAKNILSVKAGSILEVGSYMGRSTCLLAQFNRTVYAVDPFDGFHSDISGSEIMKTLQLNLSSRGLVNVLVYQMKVEDFAKNIIPDPIVFAYLDGDHTYEGTLRQLYIAAKLGAKEACVHDYSESGGGALIKKAIDDLGIEVLERAERMVRVKL